MMDADEIKARGLWLQAELDRMREVQHGTREDMVDYLDYMWRAFGAASAPQYNEAYRDQFAEGARD